VPAAGWLVSGRGTCAKKMSMVPASGFARSSGTVTVPHRAIGGDPFGQGASTAKGGAVVVVAMVVDGAVVVTGSVVAGATVAVTSSGADDPPASSSPSPPPLHAANNASASATDTRLRPLRMAPPEGLRRRSAAAGTRRRVVA
jgi:hypothetical protein